MISTRQCFMKIILGIGGKNGIVIIKNHQTLYTLEFKRLSDRTKDFLRVKEDSDEANEQHNSIIKALKAAAPKWPFEQINFVARRRGAVVKDDFSITSSKGLMYKQRKEARFWRRMCNAYAKRMTQ